MAIAPNLPDLAPDYNTCLQRHANIPEPKGGWTSAIVARTIKKLLLREEELEGCLGRLIKFYSDLKFGLKPN